MILQPYKLFRVIITVCLLAILTNVSAQVSNSFIVQPWTPVCAGASDGFIRITGLSGGTQPYTVRIVSGDSDDTVIGTYGSVTGSTFDIPNLAAGNYWIDYIDATGSGSSSNKLAVVADPVTTLGLGPLIITDIVQGASCADPKIYKVKATVTQARSGQIATVTLTNNLNNTIVLSGTRGRISTAPAVNQTLILTLDVPETFFNGGAITGSVISSCGYPPPTNVVLAAPTDLAFGIDRDKVGTPEPTSSSGCLNGYEIRRLRVYGVDNISATITEGGGVATDINGNPILPFSGPVQYKESGEDALPGTTIFTNLKYNTSYEVTYTDACGSITTETLNYAAPAVAQPAGQCQSLNNFTAPTIPFLDHAGFFRVNIPSDQITNLPVTFRVLSGPANWNSNITGATGPSVAVPVDYSESANTYVFNSFPAPYQGKYYLNLGTADRPYPPGSYTIQYSDACGNSSTFTVNQTCAVPVSSSYSLNYCNNNDGSADLTYMLSGINNSLQHLTLYNSANVAIASGIMGGSGITLAAIPPGTYKVRFGGVDGSGNIYNYPNLPTMPRLTDNYIYEEEIVVAPLLPLDFSSTSACGTTINAVAAGGVAPYNYFLFTDETKTTQIVGPQSSGVFSGLTTGNSYYVQVVDACGQSFGQTSTLFVVPSVPTFSVTQPTCSDLGSIVLTNLPAGNWQLNQTGTVNTTINGSGASITVFDLAEGTYRYSVNGNESVENPSGCTSNNTSDISVNAAPDTETIALSSAVETDSQISCVGRALDDITYSTGGGATSASVSGLPAGVSGAFAAGVMTISGTSTVSGTFNYSVTTTGACPATTSGTITINPDCESLPVRLISFQVSRAEQQMILDWKTANEENFSHYEILKSGNKLAFHSIGTVSGSEQTDYQFVDTKPVNGINYYQLRMVDLDGSYAKSRILAAEFDAEGIYLTTENPVSGNRVQVQTNSETPSFELMSASGTHMSIITQSKGNSKYQITVPQVTSGLYILLMKDNGVTIAAKVIFL